MGSEGMPGAERSLYAGQMVEEDPFSTGYPIRLSGTQKPPEGDENPWRPRIGTFWKRLLIRFPGKVEVLR
jgi:hypothetical protein